MVATKKTKSGELYDVLSLGDYQELSRRINLGMQSGSIVSLVGGLATTYDPQKGIIYSQAILRKKPTGSSSRSKKR